MKENNKMNIFKKYFSIYFFLGFLILNFFIWSAVLNYEKSFLTVAFLDVGQGDAIFIEAPNGNQILIDGGSNKKVLRELGKIIPFYDRSIDVVLVTHPDKDHIGGLIPIIDNFKVDYILESGASSKTAIFQKLQNVIQKEKAQKILARRGMKIYLDQNIYLEILFPDREVSQWKPNDASIVAKLIDGNQSFLLTGDSPQKIEKYLVSLNDGELKSNVLKLGHHGSKTSNSEIFLGYVSPEYAVISAGKNNRYGHPHQEVMDLVNKFGIFTEETSKKGTIIFQTDGENLYLR